MNNPDLVLRRFGLLLVGFCFGFIFAMQLFRQPHIGPSPHDNVECRSIVHAGPYQLEYGCRVYLPSVVRHCEYGTLQGFVIKTSAL